MKYEIIIDRVGENFFAWAGEIVYEGIPKRRRVGREIITGELAKKHGAMTALREMANLMGWELDWSGVNDRILENHEEPVIDWFAEGPDPEVVEAGEGVAVT